MDDAQLIHLADQNDAINRSLGARRGAYYHAARQAGAPRWLAAAVTLIDAYGDALHTGYSGLPREHD